MTAVEDLLKKQSAKRHSETKILVDENENALQVGAAQVEQDVKAIIESNCIVVFSKSYCPYCRQAKMVLRSIPNLEFAIVEMDDGQHDGWQVSMAQLAKSKAVPEVTNNNTMSVPQIFIHQKCVGGADDLADMYADQRLATLLGRSSLS
jgi:glutaredoxin 3